MKTAPAVFVKTAASPKDFILDDRPRIVFAGKSNVGKSSVINSLLGRNNLARVGAAPGKTTNINYFLVSDAVWFIDLPGYGYAKVAQTERERWGTLMESFFTACAVSMGVQIVDARHKPTELDQAMTALFQRCGCPFVVAANKFDKLKKSEAEPALALIRETLALPESVRIVAYSAQKGTGKGELLSLLSGGIAL